MIYTLTAISLFIVPFLVVMGMQDSIRYPKEMASILSMFAICAVGMYSYRLKPLRNIWLSLFLGWCILLTFLTTYIIPITFPQVVIDVPSQLFAWKELFYILLSLLTIYILTSHEKKSDTNLWFCGNLLNIKEVKLKHRVSDLSKTIVLCSFIMSIYALIQAIGIDEIFRTADIATGWVAQHPLGDNKEQIGDISRRVVGMVGNPTVLSIWIAMCIPFCLYLGGRLGYGTLILNIAVICITKSASGVIGAVTGVMVFLAFRNFKVFMIALVVLLISTSVIIKHNTEVRSFVNPTGRLDVLKESWNILKEKSLTGLGLGTFEHIIGENRELIKKLGGQKWRELHNEYGQIFWSTGLIGFCLFGAFIVSVLKKFLMNITNESAVIFASLCVFMITSFTMFNFRVAPVSYYGVILTGVFLNTIGE